MTSARCCYPHARIGLRASPVRLGYTSSEPFEMEGLVSRTRLKSVYKTVQGTIAYDPLQLARCSRDDTGLAGEDR